MLLELLETVVASAGRRTCWVFAQLEADSADSADSVGFADFAGAADSCEHPVCCGHATSPVGWRFDARLALGPGLGSCGSCCRLVRDARFRSRLGCVVMACLRRLVVVRIAFASGA